MKRIGLIVAVELDAVKENLHEPLWEKEEHGFALSCYQVGQSELIVAHCGVGQFAAIQATEYLILNYQVSLIFNFGVVGALTEQIASTPFVFVEDVVHSDADLNFMEGYPLGRHEGFDSPYLPLDASLLKQAHNAMPEAPLVRAASGDAFIASTQRKQWLHETFQADICDMEISGIAYTAARFNVPCFSCKMVGDSVHGGVEEYHATKEDISRRCFSLLLSMESLFRE
ncbi:MAG: 5'-methylthioadenosine/S-adenosylhomocysteine nucleosidase [Bacilli bacterium]|nr:5'-methylthioadenosine/S-adenosylhomocysteine nucleosidase [Bacilli bacterium]